MACFQREWVLIKRTAFIYVRPTLRLLLSTCMAACYGRAQSTPCCWLPCCSSTSISVWDCAYLCACIASLELGPVLLAVVRSAWSCISARCAVAGPSTLHSCT